MEVYVKESIHVLDYKDNIVDSIFISDDKRTPGYAYDINITESNTGYSDLTFNMPNTIINDNADKIKNPKLKLLTPLVKLRYHREVLYMGDKPITVREPVGYGDKVEYVDKTYSNVYPNNIVEDYIMDYIVQPVDKQRDSLSISTAFTAMDYPRFNLSKKRVGMTITQDTLTKPEWSIYKNEPLSQPGVIQYEKWTADKYGEYSSIEEWDPEHAREYPLTKENIVELMKNTAVWTYGLLGTAFWWPIVSTGRYEGTMYKKGGYLVLRLYDFYSFTSEDVDPDVNIDRYSWEWTQLYAVDSYLTPNNAKNYLYHILEGTNWKVKKVLNDEGELVDDVDIVQVEISNPAGSTTETTKTDYRCNIDISNANCYNAITSVCQGLQLYPIFDCINREVSLKTFVGKNYGLTYRVGANINGNSVKADGEKIITKLYVSGGKDYNGDANINIGSAERSYHKLLNGFYSSIDDLPTSDVEGLWAIVDPSLQEQYWITSSDRKVYYYDNTTSSWKEGVKEESGNWTVSPNGTEYIVDPQSGAVAPWDPNDLMYIRARSPYGVNYILNLKWAYQNNWISKEEILELYQKELEIDELNSKFLDKYTEDRVKTQQLYNDAANNYDIAQDEFESTLNSMECKYYYEEDDYSKGTFYAFHTAPQGTKIIDGKHYVTLYHCNNYIDDEHCGYTSSHAFTECPNCHSSEHITSEDIYVPVYADFDAIPTEKPDYPYGPDKGPAYEPHLKGTFLRLVTTLDNQNKNWEISDYEKRVSMLDPISLATGETIDGYEYVIDGVYVKASSGIIEVWNEDVKTYIKAYGDMKDYLTDVNQALDKIEALQKLYDEWQEQYDKIDAEIQLKFGDYLIEGNYSNTEQPWIGLLFNEGLEASDKFSVPEVTYELDVIDSSGLIEYRQPQVTTYLCSNCGHKTYSPIDTCPKCGEDKITTILDVYNDLVRTLHSVGQIIPKAGDYVTIYDEEMGMFGVPGLITSITRNLDNPINNEIQINTSYTDDEELVGNIITATNTVLDNSDIYARTAILKSNGTIDETSIKESLDSTSADITIVSTKGNVLLNGSGLRATDPTDPTRAMKYAGNGVFKTTNLNASGDGVTWEKLMTPNGINATYITSGTIDTNKINIISGLYGKIMIDEHGLSIKNQSNKSSHFIGFDADAASKDVNYARTWGEDNNLSTFVGVDNNNNPLMYTKGYLVADKGSNIAGWITDFDGLYHLSGGSKDLWLSPNGMNGTVNGNNSNFTIYAKGNFGVNTEGRLFARNANIQGHIDAAEGTIGGFTLTSTKLFSGSGSTQAGLGVYGSEYAFWAGSGVSSSAPFRVGHDGALYARSATIEGTITASLGQIGNWVIRNGSISNGATTLGSGGAINSSAIYGTGGTIGGWGITGSEFRSDNSYIRNDGSAAFFSQSGATVAWNNGVRIHGPSGVAIGTDMNSVGLEAGITKIGRGAVQVLGKGYGITLDATGGEAPLVNGRVYLKGRGSQGGGTTVNDSAIALYAENGSIRLDAFTNVKITTRGSSGILLLQENNGKAYLHQEGISNEIATVGLSPSTLNIKKNVKKRKINSVLDIFTQIDMYDYDYIDNVCDGKHDFGYVIDYLEKIPGIQDYLDFIPETVEGKKVKRINSEQLIKFLMAGVVQLSKELKQIKKEEI